jgi:hypothetical protein
MARTGLRMMPTFPSSPLKSRTAGFPQYGFKAIAAEVHGDTPYYPYLGHIPSDMMPSVWIIKDDQLQRAAAFVAEYQRGEHNSKL